MIKLFAAVLLALSLILCFPLFSFAENTGPYVISVYGSEPGQEETAVIEIRVEDVAGVGWKQITATTSFDGLWYDLTETMKQHGKAYIRISDNTEVVVAVTAPDGTQYRDSRSAYLFQRESNASPAAQDGPSEPSAPQESSVAVNPETGGGGNAKSEESAPPADQSSAAESSQPEEVDPATGKKTAAEQFPDDAAEDEAPIEPMNTDGTSTIIDNAVVGPQQREFFTFSTPLGNIFYLIVDRNKESENVYFVNAVTEQDLLALAEDESWVAEHEGAGDESAPESDESPRPSSGTSDTSGEELTEPEQEEETEPPPEDGGGSPLIVVGVVLVIALGGGYYFKIVRPKKELDSADDLEDIEYLDEDEGDYAFEDADMEDSE